MFILRLRFAGGEVRFHRPRILGLEELDEAVTLVEPKVGLPFSTLGLKALYHCDLPHPEAPSVALRPRRDRKWSGTTASATSDVTASTKP